MGCTSGKEIKKRTTSLEDVSQKKDAPKTAVSPNENGQIVATKNRPNESTPTSANNVVQIPGANKSFLAPDGIPFIDEDSEEELEEKVAAAAVVQQHPEEKVVAVQHQQQSPDLPTSPDQNKNFITPPPPTSHELTTDSSSSALRESSPSSDVVAAAAVNVTTSSSHHVEDSRREGVPADCEEKQGAVVGEILELELRQSSINTTSAFENANSPHTDKASTEFADSSSRSGGGAAPPRPEDVIAATKIQAGIRGFLDRKKVSKIRRESQQHREVPTISVHLEDEPQEFEQDHHEEDHEHHEPHAAEVEVRHVGEHHASQEEHIVYDDQEHVHQEHATEQLPTVAVYLEEEPEHRVHHEPVLHEPVQHDFEPVHHEHHEIEHHDEVEHHEHHDELEHHELEHHEPEHHEHNDHESEQHHDDVAEHHEEFEIVEHEHHDEAGDEHHEGEAEYDDLKYDTAAVKIQAGFKGFKARKEVKAMKAHHHHSGDNEDISGEEEERHILLDTPADTNPKTSDDEHDPKLNLAATKIQANYKGYKTRKQMKKNNNKK